MRRFLLPLIVLSVLLLPAGSALATPPTMSSGTYHDWIVDVPSVRYADGHIFLTLTKHGVLTGSVEGEITETMYIVEGDKIATFKGIQICDPCTVNGRVGTYVARIEGTSKDGYDQGHYTYLSGTGDLANLRGQGTIDGTSGSDESTGTYSGVYHFDP